MNDRQAQSGFARAVEPRLAGASAAELIGENACTRAHGWSVGLSNQAVVRHVSAPAMEPRITSVPIALVVGGVLIATLGITQQVRRSRASRL